MNNKPQTHLNRIRTPNLNEQGKVKVKPYLPHKSGLKGLGLGLKGSKTPTLKRRGIANLIPFIVLGLIVVGLVGYMVYQSKQVKGLTQEEVDKIIKDNQAKQVVTQPSQQTDDKKTPLPQPQNPTLTPDAGSGVVQCASPTGFFSIVYARKHNFLTTTPSTYTVGTEKGDIVGIWKYTGNCPADIYLEAGIINAPTSGLLSFLPSEFDIGFTGAPSNCDGNKHFNGAVYHVQPNQDIKFRFNPDSYGAEGTYPVNIGAYWGGTRTGCVSFGGATLQELHTKISFSDSYTAFQLSEGAISRSYEQVT